MSDEAAEPQVRYEIGGKPFDFEADGNIANRLVRRTLIKNGESMRKKFGHLVHPETGERPTLVVSMPDPSKPSVERRLDTDSETLRAWLVAKGFVKEQRIRKAAAGVVAEASKEEGAAL